jgi:tetratricopeptide (TPR) repeat protein
MIKEMIIILLFLTSFQGSFMAQDISQFKLAKEMQIAYEQKDWESAYNASSQLTSLNPTKGRYWFGLGESAYNLKKYDEALIAYHKSVELGHWNTWAAYNIACIHSLKGEVESAIKWINKAVEWGYKNYDWMKKDEDLANIQDHPGFLKLYGEPVPENIDRVSGWRHDLMFLDDRAKTLHYNLYDKITPAQWKAKVDGIYDSIPNLSDEEIVMEMMKLVAMIGDGHTSLYPPSESRGAILSFHRLPILFESFTDGIFITDADEDHEDLIGARVISAGSRTMEDLLNSAGDYLGKDNKMGIKRLGPYVLTFTEFYFAEGVSDSKTEVNFKIENNDKQRTITLNAASPNTPEFAQASKEWNKMYSSSNNELPLWHQSNDERFWYKYFGENDLIYFQYNSIGNKEEQRFQDFSKELYHFTTENNAEYLVIDLRHNGGGNSYLNRFLLETLFKLDNINSMGHLFVIIGRQTFSAAQNLATDLQYLTNAIFMGEPTASKPNFIGETNILKLPYSGLTVSLSDRWHQGGASNSRDYRTWIAPDVLIEMSSEDYKNNIDPVMDTITKFIDVKLK